MLLSQKSIRVKLHLILVLWVATLSLYLFGLIPALNAALIPLFTVGLYAVSENKLSSWGINHAIWVLTFIVGFFIAIYRPGSFDYPLVWQASSLYPGGDPYSLFVNTSKAIGGYIVVVWLFSKYGVLRDALGARQSAYIAAFGSISMILIASMIFGVGWQFKVSDGILFFIIFNLGVTVVSEEAFFRLLLQAKIASFFKNVLVGKIISVCIVTILFALSHTPQIGNAFFLYLIAGGIYGTVYAVSGRLSAAIAVHFGVNILHFVLLQYPIPSNLG